MTEVPRIPPLAPARYAASLTCAVLLWSAAARAETFDPPALRNERSQFVLLEPLTQAPSTPLLRLDGHAADLSAFLGKVVLLNFWASWCPPCVKEMPSLDALAASHRGDRFAVVAVSLDRDNGEGVRNFLSRHPLRHVVVLRDPRHRFGALREDELSEKLLPVYGLPTSYILDRQGRVTGYLVGPADWTSTAARAFVDYFVAAH